MALTSKGLSIQHHNGITPLAWAFSLLLMVGSPEPQCSSNVKSVTPFLYKHKYNIINYEADISYYFIIICAAI